MTAGCRDKYISRSKEDLATLLDIKDKEKYDAAIKSLSAEELSILSTLAKHKLAKRRLELRKRADYLAKIIEETAPKLDGDAAKNTDPKKMTWQESHQKMSKENDNKDFVPWEEKLKELSKEKKEAVK